MKAPLHNPFIPAWLDDAGLTQPEFRLYCHLCRRAENATGIAWPSVDGRDPDTGAPLATSIISVCGMARRTAWKTIKSLIEKGLIENLGRNNFGKANRYRVLVPISANEAPIESPIMSNEAPNEDLPIGANEAPSFGANGTLHSAQMRPREGNPRKGIHRKESNREHSPEGIQFAQWFKSSLPETVNLSPNWKQSFAEVHDKLVRLDKRTPEQIREVCRWARSDSFWKSNFMSPSKLRDRNPGGIQYFDVFAEKMKPTSGQTSNPPAQQASTAKPTRRHAPETTI